MGGQQLWFPEPIWKDEPCYIIGGGSSLEGFPWESLRGRNVLGCNAAFYLGAVLVPVTVFGDAKFIDQHRAGLEKYAAEGGLLVSNSHRLRQDDAPDWIRLMKKQVHGLCEDGLGWNGNTGASAINLALHFGANPIYLLGYDMGYSPEGKAHFHNAYSTKPKPSAYARFQKGMKCVARDLRRIFPGRQVVNLEDGTSALEEFPKESLRKHFAREEALA